MDFSTEEINIRAAEVDKIAKTFVLSHTIMAVGKILQDDLLKKVKKEIRERLENSDAPDTHPNDAAELAIKRNSTLSPHHRVHIAVEYCDLVDEKSARLARGHNNCFYIMLPKTLVEDRKPMKLRELVGHEPAHLLFDLETILSEGRGKNLTESIRDLCKEHRCNFFAEKLIELRDAQYIAFNEALKMGENPGDTWY